MRSLLRITRAAVIEVEVTVHTCTAAMVFKMLEYFIAGKSTAFRQSTGLRRLHSPTIMSSWRTCITRTRRSCHLESQSSRSWQKRSTTSSTSKTQQSETKERNRQQTSRSHLHRDSTRTTMKNSSQNQNGTIWTFQTTRSWMTKKMSLKNRLKRLVSISLRWSQCVPSAEVKSLTNTCPRAAITAVWPVGGRWGATW